MNNGKDRIDNVYGYSEPEKETNTISYSTKTLDCSTPFSIVKELLFELNIVFSSYRIIDGEYAMCNAIKISRDRYDIELIFEPQKDNLIKMTKTSSSSSSSQSSSNSSSYFGLNGDSTVKKLHL